VASGGRLSYAQYAVSFQQVSHPRSRDSQHDPRTLRHRNASSSAKKRSGLSLDNDTYDLASIQPDYGRTAVAFISRRANLKQITLTCRNSSCIWISGSSGSYSSELNGRIP